MNYELDPLARMVPGLARRLGDPLAQEARISLGGQAAAAVAEELDAA
jgi:hypothetical protein